MYRSILYILVICLPLGLSAQEQQGQHELSVLSGVARAPELLTGWGWCDFCPGPQAGEGSSALDVSYGIAYSYLRSAGRYAYGGGGSWQWMGGSNGLKLLGLHLTGEYRFGDGRWQPLGQLTGGFGLPFGSSHISVRDRHPSVTVHPAVGLLLRSGKSRRNAVTTTLGYRITRVRFDENDRFNRPLLRRLEYRRLTLTLGFRF